MLPTLADTGATRGAPRHGTIEPSRAWSSWKESRAPEEHLSDRDRLSFKSMCGVDKSQPLTPLDPRIADLAWVAECPLEVRPPAGSRPVGPMRTPRSLTIRRRASAESELSLAEGCGGNPCSVPQHVQDVLDMAHGTCWHVVHPMEDALGRFAPVVSGVTSTASALWDPRTSPSPLEIPEGATSVLVLCDLSRQALAHQYIKEMKVPEHGHGKRPAVVVMLLGEPGRPMDIDAVLAATRSFFSIDIDDVLALQGGCADLKVALALSVQRIKSRRAGVSRFQRRAHEQEHLIRQYRDQSNRLFWAMVHTILPGFPKMQNNIPNETLCPGVEIGTCVLGNVIGNGMLASVYEAKDIDTGQVGAVKAVHKDKLQEFPKVQRLWNECRLLTKLSKTGHVGIVRMHGVLHAREHIFILMEYAGSSDLQRTISESPGGRLPCGLARQLGKQIASAVAFCHLQRVAHRDLKPENIAVLADSGCAKLVDFGLAVDSGKVKSDVCGTMPFLAPEVMGAKKEPYEPAIADVWSLGVIILEMFGGVGIFNRILEWPKVLDQDVLALLPSLLAFFHRRDLLAVRLEKETGIVDPNFLSLLTGLLSTEPTLRWSAAQAEASTWLATAGG